MREVFLRAETVGSTQHFARALLGQEILFPAAQKYNISLVELNGAGSGMMSPIVKFYTFEKKKRGKKFKHLKFMFII